MDQLAITNTALSKISRAVSGYWTRLVHQYRKPRKITAFLVLFVLYAAGALLSHSVYDLISPALIWPSAGIALGILYLEGEELWPAVALASFIVSVLLGMSPLIALGLAFGNVVEQLVALYILRKLNFTPLLASLADILALICIAVLCTMISPTIGSIVLWAAGTPLSTIEQLWGPWWLGRMLSDLVLGTLIMRWFVRWPMPRSPKEILTWVASFAILICISVLLFWTPYSIVGSISLVYLILVPLIWMALSIGPRAVTLALFLMTSISLSGVLFGSAFGKLPQELIAGRLVQSEIFDLVVTIIFLIFVCSEEGRKLASRSLREHIGQLEDALIRISQEDKAKNEFLAILAHELRNPLAPILSSLELMRIKGNDPREQALLLNTMDDRVRTMARLLDDLLDISRISQKKFKLQKETIDLGAILQRSAETAAVLMQNKNHTLIVSLPEGPVWIQGDPVRLEQVIVNLLNNAAKYTEPGGTISLFAKLEPGSVAIHVKDTGVGIPREMIGRIFEPFLQVEQARKVEGLGIGLSLAKRLVEMHQGTIEAHSEGLGRGSEFVVTLPVPTVVQLPMPTAGFLKRQPAKPKNSLNILVVDDNKLAAEGLGKLLTHKGHQVTLAFDGAEALETAPRVNPEVIILDIGLPDMDGYSVARQLKEMGVASILIALTGYGQEEDKMKARAAGFDHHLTKPVSLEDVETALANLTRKHAVL
jgi:signal transduction histidine kinase/CheY-like chemotaxis protein